MKAKLLTFRKQPFPFEKPVQMILLSSLVIGLFVALFLMIFQPFGTERYIQADKAWIIWGYGLVTFLVLLSDLFLIPLIFPKIFNETNWSLLREVGFQFWHILSIGTANILYACLIVKTKIDFFTVLNFYFITLSIGFFPIVIGVFTAHYFLLKKYVGSTEMLNQRIASGYNPFIDTAEKSGRIVIASENGREKIDVNLRDLLFIKSIENYVEVVQVRHSNVDKKLLRSTLKRIEDDLKKYPFLFRCHRTYLVNVNHISRITGNSQGYKLIFNFTSQSIPVARGCSKRFFKLISQPTL